MTLSRIPTNTRIKKSMDPGKKKILFVLGLIFAIIVLYGLYSLKQKVVPDSNAKIPVNVQSGDQPLPKKQSIIINAGGFPLNIRADHDAGSKKVGEIPDKTKVEVQAEIDGWYQISYGGKNGWISKKYTILADQSQPAQTQGANLQTFTGSGFSFKYSKDWNVQNYSAQDMAAWVAISNSQLPANPPAGSYFIPIEIKVYTGANKPTGGFRTDAATQKAPISVGGVSGTKYSYTSSDTSTQVNTVEVVKGSSVYDFYDNGGYLDDLNKILSTFIFN